MDNKEDNFTLDLDRCHEIQEIMNLLESLMQAENRPTLAHTHVRHHLLDAGEQLYRASLIYLELIERQRESAPGDQMVG